MPRVLHCRRDKPLPPGTVYIGRPSIWGNPFVIGKDGDRRAVVEKYAAYLIADAALMARLPELRGRDLACWCAPAACHGDVLLRLANQEPAAAGAAAGRP